MIAHVQVWVTCSGSQTETPSTSRCGGHEGYANVPVRLVLTTSGNYQVSSELLGKELSLAGWGPRPGSGSEWMCGACVRGRPAK